MTTITQCTCGSTQFAYTQVLISAARIDAANPNTLIVSPPSDGEDTIECTQCGEEYLNENDTLQLSFF